MTFVVLNTQNYSVKCVNLNNTYAQIAIHLFTATHSGKTTQSQTMTVVVVSLPQWTIMIIAMLLVAKALAQIFSIVFLTMRLRANAKWQNWQTNFVL